MQLSSLALHMPDADQLTPQEIGATLELKPVALLVCAYAQWDGDKGVSDQIVDLVGSLGHDRLYVRFHADPHPPGYARKIGGPEAWGRLCAQRMTQYYEPLERAGVTLHAILANEVDADYEGGLGPEAASGFYRRALNEYAAKRPLDILHVPATTGAPETHRRYLERYRDDGWVDARWWIDGHGYDGDLENVLNVLENVFPDHQRVITETNDLADFGWPIELLRRGRAADIVYFTLNWAMGGEGRIRPPSPDDAAKRMSLLRFPDRYAQFLATVPTEPEPAPPPEEPMPETARPLGIDVASYQGAPDWDAVKAAGISFAFTKVTEDDDYQNPTFVRNWAEIKRVGIVRGAYHFARPDGPTDAEMEAEYFVERIESAGGIEPGDILALDLEAGWGDLGAWALAWLRRVEELAGVRPLVYTGAWFAGPHNLAAYPELGEYGLWLAAYQETQPDPPAPWDVTAFWQFTDAGRIDGIAGNVDMNVFNGAADRLALYGKPDAVVPPAPKPPDEPDLATLVGVAFREDGVVVPALVNARAASDWGQVDAVISFLRANAPH